ncbi:MAG TPA: hypothetical protein VLC09_05010 [Polyangiaceae bacterium]|nr:hypothetical protein [Polyangiaceae bacterium]
MRRDTRNLARTLLAVALPLSLAGCGEPLSEAECARLLDHYTEKVIDQARPSAKAVERAKLVAEARQRAALDPEFAACPRRVRRSQFDCALAAVSADDVERCLM